MDPVVGNRVKATVKGKSVNATILKRMGIRLRLEMEDGKSCWAEVADVTEIIGGSEAAAPAAPAPTTPSGGASGGAPLTTPSSGNVAARLHKMNHGHRRGAAGSDRGLR